MPLTRDVPKVLVKLGRYAILEIILRRLRACGFERVTLCVSHLGHLVRDAFGDGGHLGLAIDYCVDEQPLGTAAPLLNVPDWSTPAVVMNGDVLTTVDFDQLYRRHVWAGSALTVAYRRHRLTTNLGVVQVDDGEVQGILEKPSFQWNISSGIYAASPDVRKFIPVGEPFDMPMLINALIEHGEFVNGYGFTGPWFDIGTPAQYATARAEFLDNPDLYLTTVTRPIPPQRAAADGDGTHVIRLHPGGDASDPDLSELVEDEEPAAGEKDRRRAS